MMTRIFLIRHAESRANTAGIYQGQTYDTDLSALGRKQAQALARRFADEKIDKVFTSPLKRTLKTAFHPKGGRLLAEPLLLETNHGAWEGKSKAEINATWPNLYSQWLKNPSTVQFPGGEHFTETLYRAKTWWNKVVSSNKTIVAVTHSNIIMALLCHLQAEPLDNIWHYVMQPTAVTLIESASHSKIIYINDISHLKELQSDLSHHAI